MSPPAGSSDHAPKWATQWPTDAVADSSAGRHRRFAGHDRIRSSSSLQRSSWPQPFRPLGPADFAHSGAPKPPCSRFDAHRTPPGRVRRRAVPEPAIFFCHRARVLSIITSKRCRSGRKNFLSTFSNASACRDVERVEISNPHALCEPNLIPAHPRASQKATASQSAVHADMSSCTLSRAGRAS